MKNLIIYASKTGTTKKCAALLAANLGAENCTLWNINEGEPPALSDFDCAAIGSYLRMGVIDKKSPLLSKNTRSSFFQCPSEFFFAAVLRIKYRRQ